MANVSGNSLKMNIEKFKKPTPEMLEVLRLREWVSKALVWTGVSCCVGGIGIGIGCTVYVGQVLTGVGPLV